MFTGVAIKVVENMEKNDVIAYEDREIYLFGVQQSLIILLNLLTMAIIGLTLGAFGHIVTFSIAYIPLRSFAGGYHASTPMKCYIASSAMIVCVALLSRLVFIENIPIIILLLLIGIIIMVLSPIGNENKPLDSLEKKVYKKKAVTICIIQIVIAVIFLSLSVHFVSIGIFWAQAMVLLLLSLEIFFGRRKGASTCT